MSPSVAAVLVSTRLPPDRKHVKNWAPGVGQLGLRHVASDLRHTCTESEVHGDMPPTWPSHLGQLRLDTAPPDSRRLRCAHANRSQRMGVRVCRGRDDRLPCSEAKGLLALDREVWELALIQLLLEVAMPNGSRDCCSASCVKDDLRGSAPYTVVQDLPRVALAARSPTTCSVSSPPQVILRVRARRLLCRRNVRGI